MKRMLPVLVLVGAGLGACGGAATVMETPDRIIYLAIGASDAAGVGADPLTRGYVFRIADELDDRIDQVFLAPLAIPGATAEQLDGALELFLASEIEPNLVTVWTGPNDLIRGDDAGDFEDELGALFERLRERTDGLVIVAPTSPISPRCRAFGTIPTRT